MIFMTRLKSVEIETATICCISIRYDNKLKGRRIEKQLITNENAQMQWFKKKLKKNGNRERDQEW